MSNIYKIKITELRTAMKSRLLKYLHGFHLLKEPVISIWESVYKSNGFTSVCFSSAEVKYMRWHASSI